MTAATYSTIKVEAAFKLYREVYPAKAPMKPANNDDELKLIDTDDLQLLVDGDASDDAGEPPAISRDPQDLRLWVVRPEDVVHASEYCAFGDALQNKKIQHTNLTGNAAAHAGGELVMINGNTLAVNGASGRYGPKSAAEMMAIAKAFKDSGYNVWYYAYDDELDIPYRFGSRLPEWVA